MNLSVIFVSIIYLVLVLVGQVLFKKGAQNIAADPSTGLLQGIVTNWNIIIAVITYMLAMTVWVWLLKHIDLSRLFPIMSALLMLSVPLVSAYFLNESLSIRYWLAVACIFAGIALMTTELKTI